jgi:hypothetical protein
LLAVVASTTPAVAQTPDAAHLAAAHRALTASGTIATMVAAMRANLPAQRAAMPQVPAEFWARFAEQIIQRAPELVDSIAVVYARKFTVAELDAMTAFYNSAVGKRLRDLQPELVTESSQIGQRWGARIGAEVGSTLPQ